MVTNHGFSDTLPVERWRLRGTSSSGAAGQCSSSCVPVSVSIPLNPLSQELKSPCGQARDPLKEKRGSWLVHPSSDPPDKRMKIMYRRYISRPQLSHQRPPMSHTNCVTEPLSDFQSHWTSEQNDYSVLNCLGALAYPADGNWFQVWFLSGFKYQLWNKTSWARVFPW